MFEFEWDKKKSEINREKHGIDLEEAKPLKVLLAKEVGVL